MQPDEYAKVRSDCFEEQYHSSIRQIVLLCLRDNSLELLLRYLGSKEVHEDLRADEPYVSTPYRISILIAAARSSSPQVFFAEISSYAIWLRDQRKDPVYAPEEDDECDGEETKRSVFSGDIFADESDDSTEETESPQEYRLILIGIASRIAKLRSIEVASDGTAIPSEKGRKFRSADCVAKSDLYLTQSTMNNADRREYLSGIFPYLREIDSYAIDGCLEEMIKSSNNPGTFSAAVMDYESMLRDVMALYGAALPARVMSIGSMSSRVLDVKRRPALPGEHRKKTVAPRIVEIDVPPIISFETKAQLAVHLAERNRSIARLLDLGSEKRLFVSVERCKYLLDNYKSWVGPSAPDYPLRIITDLSAKCNDPFLLVEERCHHAERLESLADEYSEAISDEMEMLTDAEGLPSLPRLIRPSTGGRKKTLYSEKVFVSEMSVGTEEEASMDVRLLAIEVTNPSEAVQTVADVLNSISQRRETNATELATLVRILREAHGKMVA